MERVGSEDQPVLSLHTWKGSVAAAVKGRAIERTTSVGIVALVG